MSYNFVFDFLKSVFTAGPAVWINALIAFAVGVAATVQIGLWTGWLRFRRSEPNTKHIDSLEKQIRHHEEITDKLTQELQDSQDKYANLHGKAVEIHQRFKKLHQFAAALKKERDDLFVQMTSFAESDGRIWEAIVEGNAVPFKSKLQRRSRIISLVNLKGGVGKTTLTANIAYTLATQGDRVLLVDLDHQGSLTSLFLNIDQVRKLQASNRLIQRVFENCGEEIKLSDITEPINGTTLSLSGAYEELSRYESKVSAAWQMKSLPIDGRLILRRVFHSSEFADAFDWILIDCPPRLTTSSINALACSDYFIVPAVTDKISLDAVPRMLRWVSKLKSDAVKLCPHLSLLGVVASMTNQSTKLTPKEVRVLKGLKTIESAGTWDEKIYLFESFVPRKIAFRDFAAGPVFPRVATRDKSVASIFENIVQEIRSKVPHHGSVTTEEVHS
jgi:cellulose biosynthesis protein BcsQ